MAKSDWILPCADAACGKVFHPTRQSAEGHRIALEFWDQATGRTRKKYRLVTYRCRRCGGYHLARKRGRENTAVVELRHPGEGFEGNQRHTEFAVGLDARELDTALTSNRWLSTDF